MEITVEQIEGRSELSRGEGRIPGLAIAGRSESNGDYRT